MKRLFSILDILKRFLKVGNFYQNDLKNNAMDFKAIAVTALAVIIGLVAYDMFVKKALKLDTYDEYESLEE